MIFLEFLRTAATAILYQSYCRSLYCISGKCPVRQKKTLIPDSWVNQVSLNHFTPETLLKTLSG